FPGEPFLTATATDAAGNTSEFSAAVTLTALRGLGAAPPGAALQGSTLVVSGGANEALTGIADPAPRPGPGVAGVGGTLVITGSAGDDIVRLARRGGALRVYASFLPAGVPFLAFRAAAVKDVRIALGDGNDVAAVARGIRLPVLLD